MDAKSDYALATHSPQPPCYSQRTMLKNQDRQVLFSVSAISSQLESSSFDLARNFGPISVAQPTEAPYPYSRPCDIVVSPDQHRSSFPQSQQAPLADVTPYIFDSGYPPNPHPSQSSYQISSGHEAFHINLNQDLNSQSLSLSLDLAIQTPPAFSSVPSNYSAVRRYHEDQSRQHAQVLQQLTRPRDGRRQSSSEDSTGNGVLSASFEITPTGRRAEFYHAASSIPMSNIPLHQPRPPEHTTHQLQHSHQSQPFNQYQHPYYHNRELGYPENGHSEQLDVSTAHVSTTRIHENADPISTFQVSTKTMQISNPSTTIALESNIYAMRSGPRSNAQSIPQPSTHSFEGVAGACKVHPPTSVASIASPFPVLTNGTDHEDGSSGIATKGSNLIELEAENGDEEKLTRERRLLKEDGTENLASKYPDTSTKRREGMQGERSNITGRPRTGDSKNDSVIKDGLSPPTKRRKKSKMHECQVCHKSFPRPSGLKTHMNTHNNERPYPCPYPGCNRSFGVRSNAKRHLRTHGVIPPQNTGTQPYVVDFSTPMVLEDGRLGLNGGEGTGSNMSCHDDDERPTGVPQRPAHLGRGRGRQFKLRWMPPSSSTRSAVAKGKGKKKGADSPSVEPVEPQDLDVKVFLSRSSSQENGFLEEDQEGEDADGHTDWEEDGEMDYGDEDDEQHEDLEAEEVDRKEEEFTASDAMLAGIPRFRPDLSNQSRASSPRSPLSSSLSASASTSTTSPPSLPPSALSSNFTSVSPIPTQNASTLVPPNVPKSAPISSPQHSIPQVPLSASFVCPR